MKGLMKRYLRMGIVIVLLVSLSLGLSGAWWDGSFASSRDSNRVSRLPGGNPIKDGKALLRYALPIDSQPVRAIQADLEDIANHLRASRRWGPIKKDLRSARWTLSSRHKTLLASVVPQHQAEAETILSTLDRGITTMLDSVDAKDKGQLWLQRGELLDLVGQLEEWMVPRDGLDYGVPEAYGYLPQLQGRATVAIETAKGNLTVVVDGYNAPITAGNFVDLVQRGFYDGLPFTRAEDVYVLQTGDPPGPEAGFVDPETGRYRSIPLEIKLDPDTPPLYGMTSEAAGRYRENPVLPFSAYGTLALARPEGDPNGGSSQFFFFLFDPALTPAGLNLLDGRYAVFGYTVEGQEVLDQLKRGDRIETARVIAGGENLVYPDQGADA